MQKKKKLKKSIVPANSAKVNAKQMERDIMFRYLMNQTTALDIKQQLLKVEMDQKERDSCIIGYLYYTDVFLESERKYSRRTPQNILL